MTDTVILNSIIQDLKDGNIDAAYDADLQIQSLIVKNSIGYKGYIIIPSGAFKSYDFSFAPPSAKELITAYVVSIKDNISIQEAILYNI